MLRGDYTRRPILEMAGIETARLLVVADDIDAKFQMMATALEQESAEDDEFTGRDNALRRPVFRGLRVER